MSPVATEALLMFVEEGATQSADDPLTVFLPNPKYPCDRDWIFGMVPLHPGELTSYQKVVHQIKGHLFGTEPYILEEIFQILAPYEDDVFEQRDMPRPPLGFPVPVIQPPSLHLPVMNSLWKWLFIMNR
jgi:hypothetical protein